jgi:hypothetical protein
VRSLCPNSRWLYMAEINTIGQNALWRFSEGDLEYQSRVLTARRSGDSG